MLLNGRKAHFLEVFLPNLSSNRLKVPPKFVHHLGNRTSGSFSLIGPSGNQWSINLFEYDGHFYFREGWPTFVKDHDIQCGDTLVFGYDGQSTFTIQIFDESSCEKDEAFLVSCSQQNFSQGAAESNKVLGKRLELDNEDLRLELVAEKKMRSGCVSAPQVSPAQKMLQMLEKYAMRNSVMASHTMVVLACPAHTQKEIENLHVSKSSEVKTLSTNKQNKQKIGSQKVPNVLKFIVEGNANYFKSTFPYFVKVMSHYHINSSLKFPSHFSSLHLPKHRTKITLMNQNGNCWFANTSLYTRCSRTIHSICGGWKAFVCANNIKIEDVCIFELVGKLQLRVHILRMGLEELERQLRSQSIIDADYVKLGERDLKMIENVTEDTTGNSSKDLDEMNECEADIQHEATSCIDTVDPIAVQYPTCALASSIETENQKVPSMLKFIEERAAHYFKSTFPYFVRVMSHTHINGNSSMKIPSRFSSLHLPKRHIKITLVNLNGDCWIVNANPIIRRSRSFIHNICGGWKAFVRANNIKIEDVCVFELVGELQLRVHVLQMGLEELKQLGSQSIIDADGAELGERGLEMIDTVAEGITVNPLKDLEKTNECDTSMKHDATSLDTVDPIVVLDCASASSLGTA